MLKWLKEYLVTSWRSAVCHRRNQGGGVEKKFPGTGVQLFFRGVPPDGEGGTKKKSRENFSGPQKLKFP